MIYPVYRHHLTNLKFCKKECSFLRFLHDHEHMNDLVEMLLCVYSVTQLCPTLCDPVDRSPPGSSVHRTSQVRILESLSSPRNLFDPGIEPASPALAGGLFLSPLSLEKIGVSQCTFKITSKFKYRSRLAYFSVKSGCHRDNVPSLIVDCKHVGRRGAWRLGQDSVPQHPV